MRNVKINSKMRKCFSFIVLIVMMSSIISCAKKSVGDNEKNETSISASKNEVAKEIIADSTGYIVKVGEKAPNFTIKLTTGEELTLDSLRGKVVMLQFTASWCGVCRKEMPFIEKDIWLKHKNSPNFALIGIDRDEPLDVVNKFIEATGVTYPIGLDPNADIFAQYALRKSGITRNVLIDRNGNIVMLTRLFNETEFSELTEKIDQMLQKN